MIKNSSAGAQMNAAELFYMISYSREIYTITDSRKSNIITHSRKIFCMKL